MSATQSNGAELLAFGLGSDNGRCSVGGGRYAELVRVLRHPCGVDFATATTSAAFFPHLEQRLRSGWTL
jgi:hypothetical protein